MVFSCLARCKYTECEHPFFFSCDRSMETGRPRESFCSNECMLAQHRKTSTLRVQRHRAKLKAAVAAKHK